MRDDLREIESTWKPCGITLGNLPGGEEFVIPSSGINILVAGSSGGGKSTLVTIFLETPTSSPLSNLHHRP